MAINVTLGEVKTQQEKPFPKLMKDKSGYIYYFTSEGVGVPLTDPEFQGPLLHSVLEDWDMSNFTDYNEPVTIQNA